MMAYLTRPAMAYGGRIGLYKGESVVKALGQQLIDLVEEGMKLSKLCEEKLNIIQDKIMIINNSYLICCSS